MGINLRLSSSANGTRNLAFNPQVVASEAHVFGMDPSNPSVYYVPGNGAPAVSTSAFYQMNGLYNFRPYDLDQMGSVGASIKTANGGRRYAWVCSPDHPIFSRLWSGGEAFMVGFSFQPWDLPKTFREILSISTGTFTTTAHPTPGGYTTYEFPTIFYNPDDPDGLPIYMFTETGGSHYTGLYRSSDFVTFTLKDLSHFNSGGWSSFTRDPKRIGAGNFSTVNLGTVGDAGGTVINTIWTSTDGQFYSSAFVPIVGLEGGGTVGGSTFYIGQVFQIGGQTYCVGRETVASGGAQYATIFPINSSTYDVQSSPAKTRITSAFTGTFPGPTFLQEVSGLIEDGILYTYPTYGFPSDVNTPALGANHGGAPYSLGGGLKEQFVDKVVVRVDDTAARQAAPVGMSVSAASGVATVGWKDALPQNTYRLYYGTNATTQATLVGDYTGVTSATFSPGTGRFWCKLVTLDGGIERKSRVLSVYVSSSSAFINEHIDRVLDDGGDISTINRAFLDRTDTMLDSVGIRSVLELMTHPACGVKTSAGPLKIYDLGTTRLPRSQDFKLYTSNTTYSATSVNTGPGWTNPNNTDYGYWGDSRRGNTIQKKRQITIIAAYERTQTTEDFTFVGTGPIWGTTIDGNKIIALKHTAGSPGNIEFSLSDATSTKTASVTASGSGMQIAIGTFDGTDMLAYTGSTAGTAVSTLDPNAEFGNSVGLVEGALSGARDTANTGSLPRSRSVPSFSFRFLMNFLGSGSIHNYTDRSQGSSDVMNFTETNAKGKIQCVMVLEKALTPTQIGNVISFLQSTTNW